MEKAGLVMRFALVVSWLSFGLTMAGCMGDSEPPAESTQATSGAGAAGPLELDAPNWTLGDWWIYRGDDGVDYPYVLSEDRGSDWWMDTSSPDMAFFDAQTDISFLGPVRKSDLAGSQGDVRVKYFDWPLREGKNWTTTWDGVDVSITAHAQSDGTFVFEARRPDGRLYTQYGYDPALRWFTHVDFYDENETRVFGGSFASQGTGFSGEVYRWTLETVWSEDGQGPQTSVAQPFTVEEGVTDLWLSYSFQCQSANGGVLIAIEPASQAVAGEQGHTVNEQCAPDITFAGVIQEEPAAGSWTNSYSWGEGSQTSPAFQFLLLKRTLQATAVAL